MPILKQLAAPSSQTKRRARMDLTAEMISAPLGDFRHTMHVGRSGDAFGDTSFLGSRTGEPPSEVGVQPRSPKPSLLSRTFRSSKRSQSVTRVDHHNEALTPPGGSLALVKTALSLPYLNDEDRGGARSPVSHSLSTSPLRHLDGTPANGTTGAGASLDPELEERRFGELTDLPPSTPSRAAGMKHAVSVLSFHVDLGPSMLGEILGVMEREDDDLGYEEGRSSEGCASPFIMAPGEGEEEEEDEKEEMEEAKESGQEQMEVQPPLGRPSSSVDLENQSTGSHSPETCPQHPQHLDTCSVSSSGSAALEDRPCHLPPGGDADRTTLSSPLVGDESFFIDEEDDEIRV